MTHTAYAVPTSAAPLSSVATSDALLAKVGDLERALHQVQGTDRQSYQFQDLCNFPEATLPANFRIPKFEKYNGRGCSISHLKAYCSDLVQLQTDDRLLIHLFQKSLTGPALKWFTSLDMATIKTWNDLSQAFLEQYFVNLDFIPKREDLVALRQKPYEPFEEYVGR